MLMGMPQGETVTSNSYGSKLICPVKPHEQIKMTSITYWDIFSFLYFKLLQNFRYSIKV